MKKSQKTEPDERSAAPGGPAGHGAEAAREEGADSGRVARDKAIVAEFLAATNRLFEALKGQLEEVRSEDFEPSLDPGIDQEIQELKKCNASIRSLIALLDALKKVQNKRLEDLRWMQDYYSPGRRRRGEGPGLDL